MVDYSEVRDCLLLSKVAYFHEQQGRHFLEMNGHRFSGFYCSDLREEEGHYVIAECSVEQVTYLAIRGSFNSSDWTTNSTAWPATRNIGAVHEGWYSRTLRLPRSILLDRLLKGHRIIITGHSLGGAVAQILTADILNSIAVHSNNQELKRRLKCVSFAAPYVMHAVGAKSFNDSCPGVFINFIHSKDCVPKLFTLLQHYLASVASGSAEQGNGTKTIINLFQSISDSLLNGGMIEIAMSTIRDAVATICPVVREFLNYRPLGDYYVIDTPNGDPPRILPSEELEQLMGTADLIFTPDLWVAHNIDPSYTQYLLNQDFPEMSNKELGGLTVPDPELMHVILSYRGQKVEVQIIGNYLYSVQKIKFPELPLCGKLDYVIKPDTIVSAEKLTFVVSNETQPNHRRAELGIPQAQTTKRCQVNSFLSPLRSMEFNVNVSTVNCHPLDLCTLQELLICALYINLFANKEPENYDHEKFRLLRTIIDAIILTVPAEYFFGSMHPLAETCFERNAQLTVSWLSGTEMGYRYFQRYKEAVRKAKRSTPPEDWPAYWDTVLHSTPSGDYNGRGCMSIVVLLELLSPDHDTSIARDVTKTVVSVLSKPFFIAQSMMQADPTPENYQKFLGAFSVGLAATASFASPIGNYFHPDQTSLGPVAEALEKYLLSSVVAQAMRVSATLFMGVGGIYSFVALVNVGIIIFLGGVLNPLLLVGVGLGVTGILMIQVSSKFPSRVIRSSHGLEKEFCSRLNVPLPPGSSVGSVESALEAQLRGTGTDAFAELSEYTSIVREVFPNAVGGSADVARRLKLALLSSKLREAMKDLPIVLLTGPTQGGKSTLREHLRSTIDRRNFGPRRGMRTSIPELFFCGNQTRQLCIMDTIGPGDPTHTGVLEAIQKANTLFQCFSQATVIIVSQEDNSEIARKLLCKTSRLEKDDPISQPTITCFTKADRITNGIGGAFSEGGSEILINEAADRCVAGMPYDMRSVREDPFAPRVWACFESLINIPDEYRGDPPLVNNSEDLKKWLETILYP